MIKGIIFKFDSTIYNYKISYNKALYVLFNIISNNHNIDLKIVTNKYNEIDNSNNYDKIIHIKQLLEELNLPIFLLLDYYDIFEKVFICNINLHDNFLNLLILLKNNNIKIGILFNNDLLQKLNKINKLKIEKYIDFIQNNNEINNLINKFDLNLKNIAFVGDNINYELITKLKLGFVFHLINMDVNKKIKTNNNYISFENYNKLICIFNDLL